MKTFAIPVFRGDQSGLMSINDGVSFEKALESASLFLDSAVGLLDGLNGEERSHVTESACYLVQMALAIVDSLEVAA